jgi:hypothetical protein
MMRSKRVSLKQLQSNAQDASQFLMLSPGGDPERSVDAPPIWRLRGERVNPLHSEVCDYIQYS